MALEQNLNHCDVGSSVAERGAISNGLDMTSSRPSSKGGETEGECNIILKSVSLVISMEKNKWKQFGRKDTHKEETRAHQWPITAKPHNSTSC